jgi:excisionase family DNA binding protein
MSDTTELQPLLIRVPDVARMLGTCKTGVYNLVREEKLRPAKHGGKTVFSYAEVQRYAESILAQRDTETGAATRSAAAARLQSLRQPNNQAQHTNG